MRHRKSPVTRLSNSAVQCRVDSGPRGERGVGEILGTLLCRHSSLEQAQRNKRQRKKGKGRVGWEGIGDWGLGLVWIWAYSLLLTPHSFGLI